MPKLEKYALHTDRALTGRRRQPVPLGAVVSRAGRPAVFRRIGRTDAVSESAAAEGIRVGEQYGENGVRIES